MDPKLWIPSPELALLRIRDRVDEALWLTRPGAGHILWGMSLTPLSLKGRFPLRVIKGALVMLLCGMAASTDLANAQSAGGPVLYRLNADSSFQRGCFAPCMCPVMITEPVKGTFVLTPTVANGFSTAFSVTAVRWSMTINGTNMSVTGSGTYQVGDAAGSQQQLSLYLQVNGGNVEHFDSGLVTNPVVFPNINVSISTNNQYCFDTVFKVSASPTPVPQLHLGLTSSNTVVLSWPVSSDPFVLQESPDLMTTNWVTVTNTSTVIGQENQVVLPLCSGMKCYRLQPGGT